MESLVLLLIQLQRAPRGSSAFKKKIPFTRNHSGLLVHLHVRCAWKRGREIFTPVHFFFPSLSFSPAYHPPETHLRINRGTLVGDHRSAVHSVNIQRAVRNWPQVRHRCPPGWEPRVTSWTSARIISPSAPSLILFPIHYGHLRTARKGQGRLAGAAAVRALMVHPSLSRDLENCTCYSLHHHHGDVRGGGRGLHSTVALCGCSVGHQNPFCSKAAPPVRSGSVGRIFVFHRSERIKGGFTLASHSLFSNLNPLLNRPS